MSTTVQGRVQPIRATAAVWAAENPILRDGEVGYETDTGKTKTGNGVTNWVGRPYDNPFTDAEKTKLTGIETGATADQTAGEIKTAYESNANTNAYTDAEKTQVGATETTTQLNDRDTANRNRANHTGTQAATTVTYDQTETALGATVQAAIDELDEAKAPKLDGSLVGKNAIVSQQTILPTQPKWVVEFMFDRHANELIKDNGRGGGFTSFQTIFNDKGVKFSFSILGTGFDNAFDMSIAECLTLQTDEFDVIHHIEAQNHPNVDLAAAEQLISDRKTFYNGLGFDIKNSIYLGGFTNDTWVSATRRYYRSGRLAAGSAVGGGAINLPGFHQYRMGTRSMDDGAYNTWISDFDAFKLTDGGILRFYGHAYTDAWYTTLKDDDGNADAGGDYTWQKIARFIDHIQADLTYGADDGVAILKIDDALDIYSNSIDIGGEDNYFRVSNDGQTKFVDSEYLTTKLQTNQFDGNEPITSFPENRVSFMELISPLPANFPKAGLLETNRLSVTDRQPFQRLYYLQGTTGNEQYFRIWGGVWSVWTKTQNQVVGGSATLAIGNVPANSVVQVNITATGAAGADIAIANPNTNAGQPPVGIIWTTFVRQTNQIAIRFYNTTALDIDMGSVPYVYTVLR